jgi:CRISPR-associated protein Csx10
MKLSFRLSLCSDYHVGTGYGIGTQVDSALLRDADKVPVLRGSTVEGLLRDGLWRLLHTTPGLGKRFESHRKAEENNRNETAAYCLDLQKCPLCRLFGTPAAPKHWRVSSARPSGAESPLGKDWKMGQTAAQVTARVRVSPRQRRAEARSFFKQEEGDERLAFDFTVSCDDSNETSQDEAALIYAAARMVRRFGSSRRRGRGECIIELIQTDGPPKEHDGQALLERFKRVWVDSEGPSPNIQREAEQNWTHPLKSDGGAVRYRVILRADEPIMIASRAEAGNMYDGLGYINGSTMWGALAHHAAARWHLRKREDDRNNSFYVDSYDKKQAYHAFTELLLRGLVRISPLYPANFSGSPQLYQMTAMPSDVLTCKAYPKIEGQEYDHGAKGYATVERVPEKCEVPIEGDRKCGMPLQGVDGFLQIRSHRYHGRGAGLSSELHPRINPLTQRVETGDLYGYVALDSGQYFIGEIWCRDKGAWEALRDLTGVVRKDEDFELRLGKATRRGYGKARVWLGEAPTDLWRGGKTIQDRVADATEPLTLLLLTDAILPDSWGRFRQTFDKKLLSEFIGVAIEQIEKIQVFCKSGYVDNFNNHLGLPRWRDIALKAGSTIGFKLKGIDLSSLHTKLSTLEAGGIGLRKNEGFGQVAFNHPLCTGSNTDLGATAITIPDQLRLALAPQAGMARDIQEEERTIKEWTEQLREDFKECPFLTKEGKYAELWAAVARWLYGAAGEPIENLKTELEGFGEAQKLIKNITREKKEAFTGEDADKAKAELKKWLAQADVESAGAERMHRLLIEQLANRLMAAVRKD